MHPRAPFLAFALLVVAVVAGASAARGADAGCRKPYVVPYADQCAFAYRSLKGDTSPQNLTNAYDTCARAQEAAVSCLTASDRHLHAVALGALYQDVTRQAEIALFAQQFGVAKALLTEKLQVLDVVARDGKPHDPTVARERADTKADLADAGAGLCTQTALAGANAATDLARAKKYRDLATFLRGKSGEYAACAHRAPTLSKRAYLEYVALVALEEGARAAQAAGDTSVAEDGYRRCIAESARVGRYAKAPVTGYLTTVGALCTGRMNGTFAVDTPTPIDQPDAKGFRPLTLPRG